MNTIRILRGGLVAATALVASSTAEAQQDATRFTIRVENVSTTGTLKLSNGETAPAPTAPVLWVVHRGGEPIFTANKPDRGLGLETLAEDGDPSKLAGATAHGNGVVAAGAVAVPIGDTMAGPALPGKAFEFTVTGTPGQRLSLAFMFGQSNDLFYAFDDSGIDLFPKGRPLSGDVSRALKLWDAGTETNEEPGLGANQAPRQAEGNTGRSERASIQRVEKRKDGYAYPSVAEVVRVTVTPQPVTVSKQ